VDKRANVVGDVANFNSAHQHIADVFLRFFASVNAECKRLHVAGMHSLALANFS